MTGSRQSVVGPKPSRRQCDRQRRELRARRGHTFAGGGFEGGSHATGTVMKPSSIGATLER